MWSNPSHVCFVQSLISGILYQAGLSMESPLIYDTFNLGRLFCPEIIESTGALVWGLGGERDTKTMHLFTYSLLRYFWRLIVHLIKEFYDIKTKGCSFSGNTLMTSSRTAKNNLKSTKLVWNTVFFLQTDYVLNHILHYFGGHMNHDYWNWWKWEFQVLVSSDFLRKCH